MDLFVIQLIVLSSLFKKAVSNIFMNKCDFKNRNKASLSIENRYYFTGCAEEMRNNCCVDTKNHNASYFKSNSNVPGEADRLMAQDT